MEGGFEGGEGGGRGGGLGGEGEDGRGVRLQEEFECLVDVGFQVGNSLVDLREFFLARQLINRGEFFGDIFL